MTHVGLMLNEPHVHEAWTIIRPYDMNHKIAPSTDLHNS
jgi:hypothetical protein